MLIRTITVSRLPDPARVETLSQVPSRGVVTDGVMVQAALAGSKVVIPKLSTGGVNPGRVLKLKLIRFTVSTGW